MTWYIWMFLIFMCGGFLGFMCAAILCAAGRADEYARGYLDGRVAWGNERSRTEQ